MRIAILGPLAAGSATIGGPRLRWLLVRLALAGGRAVTLEELTDALWPGAVPADPANAVQSLVSRLRRALPSPSALESVPGGYRLTAVTDAAEFEQLVRRAAATPDPAASATLLRRALGLWRGPALADVTAAPFATGHAARLEESRLSALEDLAEADLTLLTRGDDLAEADRHGAAGLVARLSELTVRHPLRERLHALHIRALHAEGRTAEALAAYEHLRRALAGELGADPGPDLRALHLDLLRAAPPPPPRTNLRTPLTSFVGRTTEIDRILGQLRGHRLVTLVGPGGAGKTRLAATVAALVLDPDATTADDVRERVWLVELAAVSDPGDVAQAVQGVLGAMPPRRPPGDTMGRLAEALSGGPVLLVLDNCEHLVDAAARLAGDLLGRCPELTVLATSREPLGIAGEALSPVGPLPLDLAVRLFEERAAAADPSFEPGPQVTEICRRLDGLPLAIELAAARLRSLTLSQVAERLDDRFALLTGGSRTSLPRHQTLRAVVAWSWDLAEDGERALAERLSVFAGTFDAGAAGCVGASLDALAALVDKSLLQQAPGGRYRMLETIREFALERLATGGGAEAARDAHAAYFLRLAETAEPHLRGGGQREWINRLIGEHDNLLAALHHAAARDDADTAVRLAAALGQFWMTWGNNSDSVGWLKTALAVPGPAPVRARAIATAVFLTNSAFGGAPNSPGAAVEGVQELIDAIDPGDDHPLLALIEPALGLFTDDDALGLAAVERNLDHPDPWTRAVLRMARGALLENRGDSLGMRADLLVAEAELAALGEHWARSQALTILAGSHVLLGDFDRAVTALETAIELIRALDSANTTGHQRVWLAGARILQGDAARGRAELEALAAEPPRGWNTSSVAFAQLELGDLARREGDLTEAARRYAISSRTIERLPVVAPQFHALILAQRAHLSAALGDVDDAARRVRGAVEQALSVKDMPVLATIGVAAAALWAARGEPARAARVLGATEQLRGLPAAHHPDVIALTARLRAELGEAAFGKEYADGSGLTREQAVSQVRDLD
ncbi:BTAD domain-containing putative transcriptional regulator [Nonomuraea sp. NPDC050540]|uniref:BTAD domain-containing putative transcriptional regulator n=1 Tax=Nonomuraea sp. NPDC050540 TaxID=3364367 RepID=UPI00379FE60A